MIKIDRHTIIQIFGSLMQQPDLLNDIDSYRLELSDFPTSLDKFIFSAINNLYNGGEGANNIRAIDIINYLKQNAMAKNLMEKENGEVFLQDCESTAEASNFRYYYNKLKKLNFLKDIQSTGHNVDKFYCDDVLNPKYTEINDRFEKITVDDILNDLKLEVNHFENKFILNNAMEETKAIDGIDALIKELKLKPEVGCKLQGDILNTVCRGGRKGKLYLRSAGSGVGKALLNNTKIPTTEGWKKVGDIKVGDFLFDRFGKPTKVLRIYPQEKPQQVYKITFKSGRVAECSGDHLWSYYSNESNKNLNKLITATTKEILDNPKGLKAPNSRMYRWSIPIIEPIQYPEKKYGVPPYIMGLILGDGSFKYIKTQKTFFFSSTEEELVQAIQEQMGYSDYRKNSDFNYSWTFKSAYENHESVWVEDILKDYPSLWQAKSENKFIPEDYLFGSPQQRFDLLAGLLDTDGSIDERGRVSFTTISPMLRDNLIELCESLGMICTYGIDKRVDKYTTGECYNVHIQAKKEDKVRMFKLTRKLNIAYKYLTNNKQTEHHDRDSIISIEPTDKYEDMTCFYVDNPEHLFIMNNCIVTHNTRSMVGDACNIAYPIRYDRKKGKWVSTGSAEKVLYVMTEQDPAEIQTMILSYLTGYNEEIFLYGTYDETEMPRIQKAIDIMKKYQDNMLFARIADPCASAIKNLFRRYNIQYGVENFFYDYIFSSPAMLEEYRDLKLPEYVCLRLFTTALKNLAIELNAFILTSTQVSNDDNEKGGFRDYHFIQGSKSVCNLVDFGCIMSRPTKTELAELKSFADNFSFIPNLVTDVYKNRRGRWNMIRIWSYNDLGTCRKQDLFVTTADMKPIESFQVVQFDTIGYHDFSDLCELYNTGELTDEIEKEFYQPYDIEPENILSAAAAFADEEEIKQRMEKKTFGELVEI